MPFFVAPPPPPVFCRFLNSACLSFVSPLRVSFFAPEHVPLHCFWQTMLNVFCNLGYGFFLPSLVSPFLFVVLCCIFCIPSCSFRASDSYCTLQPLAGLSIHTAILRYDSHHRHYHECQKVSITIIVNITNYDHCRRHHSI